MLLRFLVGWVVLLHAVDAFACDDEVRCKVEAERACDDAVDKLKVPSKEAGWLHNSFCAEVDAHWESDLKETLACIDVVQPNWKTYDPNDGWPGEEGRPMGLCVDQYQPAERDRILACMREYQKAGVIRHRDEFSRCTKKGEADKRKAIIDCTSKEQKALASNPALEDAADAECADHPQESSDEKATAQCALDLAKKTKFDLRTLVRACEFDGVRKDPEGYTKCEREVLAADRPSSGLSRARFPCSDDAARPEVKAVLACFAEYQKHPKLDEPKNDAAWLQFCSAPEFRNHTDTTFPCMENARSDALTAFKACTGP